MPARQRSVLPDFVPPMLARPGRPFDSPDHLFEVKWDGTRALVFVDHAGYRIVNRRRVDTTFRFPEFDLLGRLPAGTILDSEIVVLAAGKPDFPQLQARDHQRSSLKIRTLARTTPATCIVFDQLYSRFRSVMDQPLEDRRALLERTIQPLRGERLVLSEGIRTHGAAYFQAVCQQGLEGVMGKRLDSRYLPGQRTDAWIKIKRRSIAHCAIIGYIPSPGDDFRSLILASENQGQLRFCGKVGTGFDTKLRHRLNQSLRQRPRTRPLVPCPLKGQWIDAGLFCTVSFLERTASGDLRDPVFERLLDG